jgi:azurin
MKKFAILLSVLVAAPFALAQQKVEITGNDQMQYSTKAFEVVTGEKVTLVFKHVGNLPAVAMGHNVVILKPGSQIVAFGSKAGTAKDTGYIPQDDESKAMIFAHTKMLGGGESTEITFTAPAPGQYPFLCSFPGHWAIMQGMMTVKEK